MRNWYDLALQKRDRTTVGISGLEVDAIADFMGEFLVGKIPENPRQDIELPYTLNLVVDDLKAYYYEAVTAQPGQESPDSHQLSNWFWKETVAGKAIFALRDVCRKSEDRMLKIVGSRLLVPVEILAKTT